MTEDQAREKWCPFSHVNARNRYNNRESFGHTATRCIASDCMAWRWEQVWTGKEEVDGYPQDTTKDSKTHGYCGLAGKT